MTDHLSIHDDRYEKFALAYDLAARLDLLPPVYIVSHRRHDNLPTLRTIPALRDHATVVVAAPEEAAYRAAFPGVRVMAIPAGYGGHEIGLGRAKQFILESADLMGQEDILILDDDLTSLSILYSIGEGKVSRAFAGLVGDRRDEFQLGLLVLVAELARHAYRTDDTVVTAAPQSNNANRTLGSSRMRWETNRGGNPSQMQSWRPQAVLDLCGGIDLTRFNYHGEDISVLCNIVAAGGSVAQIPSIIGQYLDYETQSVMRTPATAPALRQEEHDNLMSLKLAPYVRTKYDMLDRPQWHALDWRKLEKDGITSTAHYLWDDGPR